MYKKVFIGVVTGLMALLMTASNSFAHGDMAGEHHDVPADMAPTIDLSVTPDAMGGFNVQIKTTNFVWAPENASGMHMAGEGHAHIYVDGEKLGRVYGEWYHLNTKNAGISEGTHTVMVDLNGNDHVPYAIEGTPIQAMVEIDVPADQAAQTPIPWALIATVAIVVVLAGGVLLIRKR